MTMMMMMMMIIIIIIITTEHSRNSVQKTAILGTSHTVREVLQSETWTLNSGNPRCFRRSTRKNRSVTRDNSKNNNIIITIIIWSYILFTQNFLIQYFRVTVFRFIFYNCWTAEIIKFFVMQSTPLHSSVTLVPLTPRYLPQHPTLEHPEPMFLLQCQRQRFTPIQNKRKNQSSVYLNFYSFVQETGRQKILHHIVSNNPRLQSAFNCFMNRILVC